MQSRVTVMLKEALNGGLFVEKHPLVFINWRCLLLHQANRVLCNYYCLNPFRCLQLSTDVKGSLHSSVNRHVNHLALFDMPNLNRFDILSISIFCIIALSISISISVFFRIALSISISISISFKSVDISTIDMSYRYIEQGWVLKKKVTKRSRILQE